MRSHISKDGQVRPCKAKTVETCTAVGPDGEKSEHFDDTVKARKRSEEILRSVHGDFPNLNAKVVVAVDMDNTLVDFTEGFREFMAKKHGLSPEEAKMRFPDPENYDFTKGDSAWFSTTEEFLSNFREAESTGLYMGLRAYYGAIKTLKKILEDDRVELRVVTARDPAYNEETERSLRKRGLNLEVDHEVEKENYPAHIFIDDKDDFAENIRSGKYIMPDNIVKEIIVPEHKYNTHISTAKNWREISQQLNEAVDRIWEKKRASVDKIEGER